MDSSIFSWGDVDNKCKQLNIDRSKYIANLIEKDLKHKKINKHTVEVIQFGLIVIILLLLLVVK